MPAAMFAASQRYGLAAELLDPCANPGRCACLFVGIEPVSFDESGGPKAKAEPVAHFSYLLSFSRAPWYETGSTNKWLVEGCGRPWCDRASPVPGSERSKKSPIYSDFLKPSDGLEPVGPLLTRQGVEDRRCAFVR
jgi:hypothetical protein